VLGVSGESWDKASPKQERSGSAMYRRWLFHGGKEKTAVADRQRVVRAGIGHELTHRVVEDEKGELPVETLLHQRVRHFTQGLALGSREWIELVFTQNRDHFGPRRKDGARRLKNAELFALRCLRP